DSPLARKFAPVTHFQVKCLYLRGKLSPVGTAKSFQKPRSFNGLNTSLSTVDCQSDTGRHTIAPRETRTEHFRCVLIATSATLYCGVAALSRSPSPSVAARLPSGGSTTQRIDDRDTREISLVICDDHAVVGSRNRRDDHVEAAARTAARFPFN